MNDSTSHDFKFEFDRARRDPLAFAALRFVPWRRLAVATAGIAIVCAVLVAFVDRPVAVAFKSVEGHRIVAFFRAITELGQSGVWYALAVVGLIACYWMSKRAVDDAAWHWRRRARGFVYVVASMLVSGTLVNLFKMIFGRCRPRFLFEDGLYGFAPFALELKHSSFPSGHTQSIVAAMIAFGFIWPRWRWAFWAFAVTVAASRFIITVHYTADVVAGAFVAIVTALIMRAAFERHGLPLAWTASPPRR